MEDRIHDIIRGRPVLQPHKPTQTVSDILSKRCDIPTKSTCTALTFLSIWKLLEQPMAPKKMIAYTCSIMLTL